VVCVITIDMELKDVPGELIRVLTPISNIGINIISIIHLREKKTNGRVPVRLVISETDEELFKKMIDELEKNDIIITTINKQVRKRDIDIVVIGHVVDTDIRDTIDRLNKHGLVIDLDLSMPDPYKESSARMKVVISEENLKDFDNELNKISKEKNLLFIKSY